MWVVGVLSLAAAVLVVYLGHKPKPQELQEQPY
jgi:hypothetical protein